MIQKLLEGEKKVQLLKERVSRLKSGSLFKRFFLLSHAVNKLKMAEDLQFNAVDNYLFETDPAYRDIAQANLSLLRNDHAVFTVYAKSVSISGSYTKKVEGNIFPNGYSYSYSVDTNVVTMPWHSMTFPRVLKGTVDHWGEIKLKTADTQMGLFKTLPKRLEGSITPQGIIEIQVTESVWEFSNHGSMTMGKLICNHLGDDEEARNQFLYNRSQLVERVENFRKGLIGL